MKQKNPEISEQPAKNSLRTFWIFCAVVSLILLISLSFRIFLLFKNSKFDGTSGFVMMVLQDDKKKAALYAFDPDRSTVSRVIISSSGSLPNIAQTLAIPIEGQIRKKSIDMNETFPLELTSSSLYSQTQKRDISVIDSLRLWYFSRAADANDKQSLIISLPKEQDALDMETAEYFIDSQLEKDKKSITVINGTSISGLGGRLERMVSRIGGSVISITTSHTSLKQSKIIYFGDTSYTVDRLTKILPYKVERREGASLSDIIIEIGEDSQRTDLY